MPNKMKTVELCDVCGIWQLQHQNKKFLLWETARGVPSMATCTAIQSWRGGGYPCLGLDGSTLGKGTWSSGTIMRLRWSTPHRKEIGPCISLLNRHTCENITSHSTNYVGGKYMLVFSRVIRNKKI